MIPSSCPQRSSGLGQPSSGGLVADQRIVDVVQLIAGKVTAAEVAERHQVSPADVELWAKAYLAGLEGAAAGSRALSKRRWPAVLIGCLVVAGLASRVSFASGSTCGETLPGTLQPFCPDDPARASEVNQNYRALIAYIEARFGSFSSPDVTLPGAVSTSRATFNAVSFDGGSPTPLIVNDTVSQALVLVGQGTAPNRRVTVRDDLAVTSDLSVNGTTTLTGNTTIGGTLNVTGTLTAPNISGTISGGGTLICQLGTTAIVLNCAAQFGGATCPTTGSSCSTSTRIICPAGSTVRDVSRDCTNPGGLVYPCVTQSFCVRD